MQNRYWKNAVGDSYILTPWSQCTTNQNQVGRSFWIMHQNPAGNDLKHWSPLLWVGPYMPPGLPRWCYIKEPAYQCRRLKSCGSSPLVGKIPWRRKWQSTPALLPEKSRLLVMALGKWAVQNLKPKTFRQIPSSADGNSRAWRDFNRVLIGYLSKFGAGTTSRCLLPGILVSYIQFPKR